MSDGIARGFKKSSATGAVVHDISKIFNKIWGADLHKRKSGNISGQVFGLIFSFLTNRWLE